MAYCLRQAFGKMSIGAIPRSVTVNRASIITFSQAVRGQALTMYSPPSFAFATKTIPPCAKSAEKRHKQSERRRMRNRSVKSAVATRIRKVFKAIENMKTELPKEESQVVPVEKLISEAYKEIDTAVRKGILHKNTGRRRKSKVARAKTRLMIEAGLYVPVKEPVESLLEKFNKKNAEALTSASNE